MEFIKLNYPAIILASLVNMVFCFFWYVLLIFGKRLLTYLGIRIENIIISESEYVIIAFTCLVSSITLAFLIKCMGISAAGWGALMGLGIGLGIVSMTILQHYIFCGDSIKRFLFFASHQIVCYTVMGAILSFWK